MDGSTSMTRLPGILAEYFLADYVEDVPLDMRDNAYHSSIRVLDSPADFPNADLEKCLDIVEAVESLGDAWWK